MSGDSLDLDSDPGTDCESSSGHRILEQATRVCVFGLKVSWKLPDVDHGASADCSSVELESSKMGPSVSNDPLPGNYY